MINLHNFSIIFDIRSHYLYVYVGYMNSVSEYGQLALLIIDSMDRLYVNNRPKEKASEQFTESVHDTWGIGDKVKNDGALLFLSIDDRMIYISIGSGLANKLPSQVITDIVDNMKPLLKQKDYNKAIEAAILEISLLISNKKSIIFTKPTILTRIMTFLTDYCVFIFIGLFACYAIYTQYQMKHMEKGKIVFEKFLREVKATQQSTGNTTTAGDSTSEQGNDKQPFISSSCPICLEDYPCMDQISTTSSSDVKPSAPPYSAMYTTTSSATTSTYTSTYDSISIVSDNGDYKDGKMKPKPEKPDESIPLLSGQSPSSPQTTAAGCKSSTTSTSKSKEETDSRRQMALQCGHTFCHSCLMAHFKQSKQNLLCPICRTHIDPDVKRPPAPPGPPFSGGGSTYRGSSSGAGDGSSGTGSGNNTGGACAESFNTESFTQQSDTYSSTTSSTSFTQNRINTSSNTNYYSSQQQQQQQQYTQYIQQRSRWQFLEWQYRLSRMHRLYPQVIDTGVYILCVYIIYPYCTYHID